jgi:predicted flap endonuclease-1-like 5' DNA nuclease
MADNTARTIGVAKIRGIQATTVAKLKALKVTNSGKLLEMATTPKMRTTLAKDLGLNDKSVLELANRADLARIDGIGKVFADLLEDAGVDTVVELSKRKPDNLHAKLAEVNAAKKVSKRNPTLEECTDWVKQAKALPRALKY